MISAILLIAMVQAGANYVLVQSTEPGEDTSLASQDYQEFQAYLSDAEVDRTVSEQQIRDCFAPIYNTGTSTGTDDATTSTDSLPSNGDTGAADDAESGNDERSSGVE